MSNELHTSQHQNYNGSPSIIARVIAAIIHDLKWLFGLTSTGYTGTMTDANGNVIEITDGGVVESVNPKLQFTTNEEFIEFAMRADVGVGTIEWGDKTVESIVTTGVGQTFTHTYASPGTYVVRVNAENIDMFFSELNLNSLLSVDILPNTMTDLYVYGSNLVTSINYGESVLYTNVLIQYCPLLTYATIPQVQTSPTFFSSIGVCPSLAGFDTTNYSTCYNFVVTDLPLVDEMDFQLLTTAHDVFIVDMPLLRVIKMPTTCVWETLDIQNCTSITAFAVTTATNALSITLTGCTKLKTLTITSMPNIINFACTNGSRLSTSNINTILTTIDAYGTNNGIIDISGQNPLRPPTGAGITAKNNLIGRGWTVTTD